MAEEYGGDTMFVNVSARTGENIDALLEAVLLTADAALDLRANPDKDARGVAIEAHLDKGRGPVATVLVQSGTLHVGDAIVAGSGYGRVRAMLDEHGNTVVGGDPVASGAGARPDLGARRRRHLPRGARRPHRPADRRAREAAARAASLAKARKRIALEDLNEALAAGQGRHLNLILKGDVSGSVEALEDALLQIDVGDEVDLRIIDRGVGAITLNNINLRRGVGRDHHRLQRPGRGPERRRRRPRGRGDPVLLGDLPGHRGDRGRAQGHAQAGVRGGPAR